MIKKFYFRFFLAFSLFLPFSLLSQKEEKKSFIIQNWQGWKQIKHYRFPRLNIYNAVGQSIKASGRMLDVYHSLVANGIYIRTDVKHNESKSFAIGIEGGITNRIQAGLWLMPVVHECFKGGTLRTFDLGWFFPAIYKKGGLVDQDLNTQMLQVNGIYKIIPYKQLHFLGIEVSGGAGLFLNRFDLQTNIEVHDTVWVNGAPQQMSASETYKDKKTCVGLFFDLRTDLYIGKGVSVFGKFNYGFGSSILVPSRSVSVGNENFTAPAFRENLQGIGYFCGIAFHFIQAGKKQPKNIE